MTICVPIVTAGGLDLSGKTPKWTDDPVHAPSYFRPGGVSEIRAQFEAYLTNTGRQIVAYIHGYDQSPMDAIRAAEALQAGFDTQYPGVYQVVAFVWQCNASPVSKYLDYLRDKQNSLDAAPAFSAAFLTLNRTGLPVHLWAHSMGNRAAMAAVAQRRLAMFESISLIAADIPRWSLLPGAPGRVFSRFADRVAVVTASNDRALLLSSKMRFINLGRRRLGLGLPKIGRPKNAVPIDATGLSDQYDPWMRHTYHIPKPTDPNLVFGQIAQFTHGE